MAITSTINRGDAGRRRASGTLLDDAATPALATFDLGFAPQYFAWHNTTDRISHEWFFGNANGTTLKTVAAGTRTLDTADVAISVSGNTVTVAAAAILQNKANRWVAF